MCLSRGAANETHSWFSLAKNTKLLFVVIAPALCCSYGFRRIVSPILNNAQHRYDIHVSGWTEWVCEYRKLPSLTIDETKLEINDRAVHVNGAGVTDEHRMFADWNCTLCVSPRLDTTRRTTTRCSMAPRHRTTLDSRSVCRFPADGRPAKLQSHSKLCLSRPLMAIVTMAERRVVFTVFTLAKVCVKRCDTKPIKIGSNETIYFCDDSANGCTLTALTHCPRCHHWWVCSVWAKNFQFVMSWIMCYSATDSLYFHFYLLIALRERFLWPHTKCGFELDTGCETARFINIR